MITVLVTAGKNWGIGKNGMAVTSIPDDVRYIRTTTTGNIAVMGRKTFEAIPQGQLQENRTNIVLSRDENFEAKGATVCHNAAEVLTKIKELKKDAYIIGGEETFREMLPYADEVQVTFIDYLYDADAYFENLDLKPEWLMLAESDEMTHFDTIYHLRRYQRRKDYRN